MKNLFSLKMAQLLNHVTYKITNTQNIKLKEYITQSKKRLEQVLKRLEWSEEDTLKDCNTNSIASSLKKVTKKPRPTLKATFPDSCITWNSLALETSALQEILQSNDVKVPCNFRELQQNFSREQKLKIYEHVIENTEKLDNNTIDQQVEGEISLADILAQKKREEKHKKRRFRKSKPTHIEEVRCLVNLQMDALQQFMENKTKKEKQGSFHQNIVKSDSKEESSRSRDEKNRFGDYYSRKKNAEKFNEHREKRSHRNSSEERFRHKHKRRERSPTQEFSHTKRKHSRSRSKSRGKHHRSSSNNIRQERISFRSHDRKNLKERIRNTERRGRSDRKTSLKKIHRRSSDIHEKSFSEEVPRDVKKHSRPYTGGEDDYESYFRKENKFSERMQQTTRTQETSNVEKNTHIAQYETFSKSRSSKPKNKEHKRS